MGYFTVEGVDLVTSLEPDVFNFSQKNAQTKQQTSRKQQQQQ